MTASRLIRMDGKYLLDTYIVIALLANDRGLIENLRSAGEVFIPVPVLGELDYGARKSSRSSRYP